MVLFEISQREAHQVIFATVATLKVVKEKII
jgi:hypothetical protein